MIHFCREASCGSLSSLVLVEPDIVKGHLLPSLLPLLSDTSGLLSYFSSYPCDFSLWLLLLFSAPTVRLYVVDLLSSLCVAHVSVMELVVPPLVELFTQLIRCPSPDVQFTLSISSVLLSITQSCISWVEFRRLFSDGLLRQLVVVCVTCDDVISPLLDNVVTIVSLFTQAADEGWADLSLVPLTCLCLLNYSLCSACARVYLPGLLKCW